MAKLLLNFDGVDLEGPEPVPAGVYDARIDAASVEVKKSQSRTDYFSLCYVIEKHPEYEGRKVYEHYVLTQKALWKFGLVLKALDMLPADSKFTFSTAKLHNKLCRIKVTQETYNDRVRNRVDAVMPPDDQVASGKALFGF